LVFFGFLTFIDPPKKSFKENIEKLEALNIKFKILTGDNELVTKKIAEQVDIPLGRIVLSEEISRMSDEQLCKLLKKLMLSAD